MLESYVGQLVVLDLEADYLVFGRLERVDEHFLLLADADLHDHGEANATKEVYALETKQFGVRANRSRVAVPRARLLAISLLDDVTA